MKSHLGSFRTAPGLEQGLPLPVWDGTCCVAEVSFPLSWLESVCVCFLSPSPYSSFPVAKDNLLNL